MVQLVIEKSSKMQRIDAQRWNLLSLGWHRIDGGMEKICLTMEKPNEAISRLLLLILPL